MNWITGFKSRVLRPALHRNKNPASLPFEGDVRKKPPGGHSIDWLWEMRHQKGEGRDILPIRGAWKASVPYYWCMICSRGEIREGAEPSNERPSELKYWIQWTARGPRGFWAGDFCNQKGALSSYFSTDMSSWAGGDPENKLEVQVRGIKDLVMCWLSTWLRWMRGSGSHGTRSWWSQNWEPSGFVPIFFF